MSKIRKNLTHYVKKCMHFDRGYISPDMHSIDRNPSHCIRFNLIMQAEFPLNALVLASEALRIANQNTGKRLFDWSFVSEDGDPAKASNGMWFDSDCSTDDMPSADVYLLFGGNLPTQRNSKKLLGHLRKASQYGAIVGGIDTGTFALAQAGLTRVGRDSNVVLHWEAEPSFIEQFPNAVPMDQIYSVQERRVYSAGGVATLDMILDLIARFGGQALANEIANALVHTRRETTTKQRNDGIFTTDSKSPLRRLVELMEQNVETPLYLSELSREFGGSERTLARLCERGFGQSPMRLYMNVRLRAARNLLFYGEHSIRETALACGFSHPAVFSRVFKRQFGKTPREFRSEFRKKQNLKVRPELRQRIAKRES